jgi:hypothetical protein
MIAHSPSYPLPIPFPVCTVALLNIEPLGSEFDGRNQTVLSIDTILIFISLVSLGPRTERTTPAGINCRETSAVTDP